MCLFHSPKNEKPERYQGYFVMYYSLFSLCCTQSTSAHTHVQKQTDRRTLPLAYACVTQRYLQHECTKPSTTRVSWTSQKPHFYLVICAVMEFRQFTGITFGKAKGRLEVTVSAWVSGWPLGRGGGDHTHRGIVCCCASTRPGQNRAHPNWKY